MANVNVAAVADMVSSSLHQIEALINSTPTIHPQSSAGATQQWASNVLVEIHLALSTLLPMITSRLDDLERLQVSAQPVTTTPGAARSLLAQGTSSQSPGRQPRCRNCHARGHQASACTTSNPSAMRKRVAMNSRIAKEARAPAPLFIPTHPLPSHSVNILSTSFPPIDISALTADATELRRRTAQSRRDKRRSRRNPTSS